jgi:hypothetical protein
MLERALEETQPQLEVSTPSVVQLRFARSQDHFRSDIKRTT